jgi:L-ascorbate metabolism protein UlaG (beta-lactamase superfamily)
MTRHRCLAFLSLAVSLVPPLGFSQAAPKSETFQSSAGVISITPIQHASMLISVAGKNIYIDPAQGKFDGLPPADLILITDIHGDHLAPDIIQKIKKPGTVIWGPKAVADKLHVVAVIANGDTRQWADWTIEAVPAYNRIRGPAAGQVYHDKGRGHG